MMRTRTLLRAGAALLFVLMAGATYQGVATALERREFPRLGRLVSVGDHQLHIHCLGEGAPLVVLEAPGAGMSAAWGWVQPDVAKVTRVCSYDRAGLGWSELGDEPYDPGDTPEQLRRVLEGAGERGPILLVGHGLGAAYATMFAARFSSGTAGLILVDDPVRASAGAEEDLVLRFAGTWAWLARVGVLRAAAVLSRSAAGLPPPAAGALSAFLNRPDHLTQAATELAHAPGVIAMATAATLPETPVTRLDVGRTGRIAFLTDKVAADRVTSAILDNVGRLRKRL